MCRLEFPRYAVLLPGECQVTFLCHSTFWHNLGYVWPLWIFFAKAVYVSPASHFLSWWTPMKTLFDCKFCILLREKAAETNVMLKTSYKDTARVKLKCMSGFCISKRIKCWLMINHIILDVFQFPERTEILKNSPICAWRLTMYHKLKSLK